VSEQQPRHYRRPAARGCMTGQPPAGRARAARSLGPHLRAALDGAREQDARVVGRRQLHRRLPQPHAGRHALQRAPQHARLGSVLHLQPRGLRPGAFVTACRAPAWRRRAAARTARRQNTPQPPDHVQNSAHAQFVQAHAGSLASVARSNKLLNLASALRRAQTHPRAPPCCRRGPRGGGAARRACIHSLTEDGMAATPRARMALALSGVCSRALSSHTSSLPGHSSQPLATSLRASARFLPPRAAPRQGRVW